MDAVRKDSRRAGGKPRGHTGADILALLERIRREHPVPLEDWQELPSDLAEHFEEYEYGGRPWPGKK